MVTSVVPVAWLRLAPELFLAEILPSVCVGHALVAGGGGGSMEGASEG